MQKLRLFLIGFPSLLLVLGIGALPHFKTELKPLMKRLYTLFFGDQPVDQSSGVNLGDLLLNPDQLLPFSGKLQKDQYEEHLKATELQGLTLIRDEYHLFQKITDSTLVRTDSGKGYRVDSLTHSFPILTPKSKKVLEALGLAYERLAGEGNFFTVSSVTRTERQQKSLKRRNRNAVDGNSSHSYGISFDISYIRFNGIRGWDRKAQKNIETILNHFQQTGRIYVIKERGQSCYHVTVR